MILFYYITLPNRYILYYLIHQVLIFPFIIFTKSSVPLWGTYALKQLRFLHLASFTIISLFFFLVTIMIISFRYISTTMPAPLLITGITIS